MDPDFPSSRSEFVGSFPSPSSSTPYPAPGCSVPVSWGHVSCKTVLLSEHGSACRPRLVRQGHPGGASHSERESPLVEQRPEVSRTETRATSGSARGPTFSYSTFSSFSPGILFSWLFRGRAGGEDDQDWVSRLSPLCPVSTLSSESSLKCHCLMELSGGQSSKADRRFRGKPANATSFGLRPCSRADASSGWQSHRRRSLAASSSSQPHAAEPSFFSCLGRAAARIWFFLRVVRACLAVFFRGTLDCLSVHRFFFFFVRSPEICQKSLSCILLNGGLFLGSIQFFNHVIMPLVAGITALVVCLVATFSSRYAGLSDPAEGHGRVTSCVRSAPSSAEHQHLFNEPPCAGAFGAASSPGVFWKVLPALFSSLSCFSFSRGAEAGGVQNAAYKAGAEVTEWLVPLIEWACWGAFRYLVLYPLYCCNSLFNSLWYRDIADTAAAMLTRDQLGSTSASSTCSEFCSSVASNRLGVSVSDRGHAVTLPSQSAAYSRALEDTKESFGSHEFCGERGNRIFGASLASTGDQAAVERALLQRAVECCSPSRPGNSDPFCGTSLRAEPSLSSPPGSSRTHFRSKFCAWKVSTSDACGDGCGCVFTSDDGKQATEADPEPDTFASSLKQRPVPGTDQSRGGGDGGSSCRSPHQEVRDCGAFRDCAQHGRQFTRSPALFEGACDSSLAGRGCGSCCLSSASALHSDERRHFEKRKVVCQCTAEPSRSSSCLPLSSVVGHLGCSASRDLRAGPFSPVEEQEASPADRPPSIRRAPTGSPDDRNAALLPTDGCSAFCDETPGHVMASRFSCIEKKPSGGTSCSSFDCRSPPRSFSPLRLLSRGGGKSRAAVVRSLTDRFAGWLSQVREETVGPEEARAAFRRTRSLSFPSAVSPFESILCLLLHYVWWVSACLLLPAIPLLGPFLSMINMSWLFAFYCFDWHNQIPYLSQTDVPASHSPEANCACPQYMDRVPNTAAPRRAEGSGCVSSPSVLRSESETPQHARCFSQKKPGMGASLPDRTGIISPSAVLPMTSGTASNNERVVAGTESFSECSYSRLLPSQGLCALDGRPDSTMNMPKAVPAGLSVSMWPPDSLVTRACGKSRNRCSNSCKDPSRGESTWVRAASESAEQIGVFRSVFCGGRQAGERASVRRQNQARLASELRRERLALLMQKTSEQETAALWSRPRSGSHTIFWRDVCQDPTRSAAAGCVHGGNDGAHCSRARTSPESLGEPLFSRHNLAVDCCAVLPRWTDVSSTPKNSQGLGSSRAKTTALAAGLSLYRRNGLHQDIVSGKPVADRACSPASTSLAVHHGIASSVNQARCSRLSSEGPLPCGEAPDGSSGLSLAMRQRMLHFEEHWVYFAGFGAPLWAVQWLCPTFVDYGVLAMLFPVCIVTSLRAVPLRWVRTADEPLMRSHSLLRRLPIFTPVQFFTGWILQLVLRYLTLRNGKEPKKVTGQKGGGKRTWLWAVGPPATE